MYKVVITDHFKKQLKRLVKKDKGLKENLKKELRNFHKLKSISIGFGVYKIRIAGQAKGKSGGYRTYLYVMEFEGILVPLCIYPKSERENLNHEELTHHLEKTKDELN